MACHGASSALQCGRGDRAPPRKAASTLSPGLSPRGRAPLGRPPRGGAGSARPQRRHWLRGGYSPLGSRPLAHASGGNGMPWRSFSLAMRTRRVRPSEKSGFGAVPRFAPVRLSSHRFTISRRGGLRTPVTTAQRQRCLPLATGSSSTHVVEMKCLGVRTALQCGRGDRAPPRKLPSTLSPGLSPLGHLTWERPPRGGAGSARLLKNAWA